MHLWTTKRIRIKHNIIFTLYIKVLRKHLKIQTYNDTTREKPGTPYRNPLAQDFLETKTKKVLF